MDGGRSPMVVRGGARLTRIMTILVLGSTGKTGRRVVARLRAAGEKVRAASRSGEVRFDWSEPATWTGALDTADAVYLIAPDDPDPVAAFVAEAVSSGVRRFVVLSGRGIERVAKEFGEGMRAAEAAVRASGAEWTILRANNFDQNFDEDLWFAPVRAGRLGLPIGEVGEPFVDVEDVAEVAAAVLTRDGHAGRVYELSGPRALTFTQAVSEIATAAGHPIEYEELTPDAYRTELLAQGLPEEVATALNAMFELMRTGHIAEPTDGVHTVLGRPATDFAEYVERVWSARPV